MQSEQAERQAGADFPLGDRRERAAAGREVRVIVASDKVTDSRAEQLAFEISQRIQTEMTYPGQVKVTVIREVRATGYAK